VIRIHPISTFATAALWPGFFFAGSAPVTAAELKTETLEVFAEHIRVTEARVARRLEAGRAFLWAEDEAERFRLVRSGEVVVKPVSGNGDHEIRSGLIHDWIGAVFIPGATLEHVLALVQNYDNHKNVYKPEVMDSRTLHREGNYFKIYLRLMKKKVITAVLSTEHDVRYFPLSPTRAHSRSYTTKVAELQDPGTPSEKEKPVGDDHGFLWRLYSYWRFDERDGGVYVECQAVSLTRNVPFGLGLLITPIIRDLPKESLTNTLRATRDALVR
jgi:hypothetical protein